MFFLILTVFIIILDQLIKYLVDIKLYAGQSVPVINDIFHITYVQNTGAGFGIFPGRRILFISITIIIITALILYYRQLEKSFFINISFAFLIGGAAGNLIDRIMRGFVVDFLDFRVWPVFNIADSAVVIGVSMLIIYLCKEDKV